jgi:hypothetical protein
VFHIYVGKARRSWVQAKVYRKTKAFDQAGKKAGSGGKTTNVE